MRILMSKYFFFYVMLLMMRYQGYDPMDMEKGLCRSYILVRVRTPFFFFPHAKTYRHITSPSSAMKTTPGAGRTKSGQAKLNGFKSVLHMRHYT